MAQEKTLAERKMQKALTERTLSQEQYSISGYLSRLKFRQSLWGVEEAEVWRALETLCQLYEDILAGERLRREQAESLLRAEEGTADE